MSAAAFPDSCLKESWLRRLRWEGGRGGTRERWSNVIAFGEDTCGRGAEGRTGLEDSPGLSVPRGSWFQRQHRHMKGALSGGDLPGTSSLLCRLNYPGTVAGCRVLDLELAFDGAGRVLLDALSVFVSRVPDLPCASPPHLPPGIFHVCFAGSPSSANLDHGASQDPGLGPSSWTVLLSLGTLLLSFH